MASSGALLLIRGVGGGGGAPHHLHHQQKQLFSSFPNKNPLLLHLSLFRFRNFSTPSALLPPDVSRLAETARITLTPNEVEEFAPKIKQVIDWFGQLQAVDLHSIEPAVRADTENDNFRQDVPETFGNREAILAAVPSYEEPYIKVPKVLNKD